MGAYASSHTWESMLQGGGGETGLMGPDRSVRVGQLVNNTSAECRKLSQSKLSKQATFLCLHLPEQKKMRANLSKTKMNIFSLEIERIDRENW